MEHTFERKGFLFQRHLLAHVNGMLIMPYLGNINL
jgi:hypothetical protein